MRSDISSPRWIPWLVWAAIIFVCLLALATRPAPCCEPELVTHTPSPTVMWDAVTDTDLAGYKLYYRMTGGVFQLACDLPAERWVEYDEWGNVIGPRVNWRGVDFAVGVQKCLDGYELENLEWAVKAYDEAVNISDNFSNIVTICMPEIWTPGEVYR